MGTLASPSSTHRYCFVMLGSGGVGKSALSIQYVQGVFVSVYDATIMDSLMRSDTVDGRIVTTTVVDTAGQEDYLDQSTPYIRMADLCIFVYSITDATTIVSVSTLFDHALKARQGRSLPFIVVGNKTDLGDHRQVSTDQGRRLSITLAGRMRLTGEEVLAVAQSPPFLETTAKSRDDAVKLFHCAVATAQKMRTTGTLCGLVHPASSVCPAPASRPVSTDTEDSDTTLDTSASTLPSPRPCAVPAAASSTSNRPLTVAVNDDSDTEHGPVLVMPTPNDDALLGPPHVGSPKTQNAARLYEGGIVHPTAAKKKKQKKRKKSFRCMIL
jgi:small GTP-binding protein